MPGNFKNEFTKNFAFATNAIKMAAADVSKTTITTDKLTNAIRSQAVLNALTNAITTNPTLIAHLNSKITSATGAAPNVKDTLNRVATELAKELAKELAAPLANALTPSIATFPLDTTALAAAINIQDVKTAFGISLINAVNTAKVAAAVGNTEFDDLSTAVNADDMDTGGGIGAKGTTLGNKITNALLVPPDTLDHVVAALNNALATTTQVVPDTNDKFNYTPIRDLLLFLYKKMTEQTITLSETLFEELYKTRKNNKNPKQFSEIYSDENESDFKDKLIPYINNFGESTTDKYKELCISLLIIFYFPRAILENIYNNATINMGSLKETIKNIKDDPDMISKITSTIDYVDDKDSVSNKQTNDELNVILEQLKKNLQEEINHLKSEIKLARSFRYENDEDEAYGRQRLNEIILYAETNVQPDAEAYITIIDNTISNGSKTNIDTIIKEATEHIKEIHKVINKLDNHKENPPKDPSKQLIPALKGKIKGWWPSSGGFPHDIQSGGARVDMQNIMNVLHNAVIINDPLVSTLNNYASNMFYDAITFLSISINLPYGYGEQVDTNTDLLITSIKNYVNVDILTLSPAPTNNNLFTELTAFFQADKSSEFNKIFNNICESFYNTEERALISKYLDAKIAEMESRKYVAAAQHVTLADAELKKKVDELETAEADLTYTPSKAKAIKLGDSIQNMKEDIDKIILNTIKKSNYLKYLQFAEEPVQKKSFFGFGKKQGGQKTQKNRNISKNRGGSRKNMNSIETIDSDDSDVSDL